MGAPERGPSSPLHPPCRPLSRVGRPSRPVLHQITQTAPGAPLNAPAAIALDADDDLWIGAKPSFTRVQLDRFSPASAALKPCSVPKASNSPPRAPRVPKASPSTTPPAPSTSTGDHEEKSNGGRLRRRVQRRRCNYQKKAKLGTALADARQLAVDNSTERSRRRTSTSSTPDSSNLSPRWQVERFTPTGALAPFTATAPYLTANAITGDDQLSTFPTVSPAISGIAIDPAGDVYIAQNAGISAYAPSGEPVPVSFTAADTPGIGESHENGGWGGFQKGIAVDPTNGDVLLTLQSVNQTVVAVDEFDSTGRFLGQFTEQGRAGPLALDSHGDLYLGYGSETVAVLGPAAYIPSLSLGEATQRTATAASLGGSVDPESSSPTPNPPSSTDCHFEYLTEAQFKAEGGFAGPRSRRPCAPPMPPKSPRATNPPPSTPRSPASPPPPPIATASPPPSPAPSAAPPTPPTPPLSPPPTPPPSPPPPPTTSAPPSPISMPPSTPSAPTPPTSSPT